VRLKFLGLLLFSGLLLAGPALADSITITGGFTTVGGSNFGTVHLLGDGGFQFDGRIDDAGGLLMCQFCGPGTQGITIPRDLVSIPTDMNRSAAQVVFDGTTFLFPSGLNGRNSQGFLLFDYRALVFPAGGSAGPIDVTAPFTFSGSLQIFGPDAAPNTPLTPPLNLVGEGILTVHLGAPFVTDGARVRLGYQYDFITPVPEPTTVLLWGTAAVGVALASWRGRRRASSAAWAAGGTHCTELANHSGGRNTRRLDQAINPAKLEPSRSHVGG